MIFPATPERFRTGGFVLISTAVLIPVTFAIPYPPHAGVLGFVPLPGGLLAVRTA